ncbi:Ubiquitin carboxyl-terminal hydrolase isozyme L3 [Chytridiales sp. JEL 0842]|nr:Ubiquitin carboxyl-terminal hydrolase isozyme L3 [Chytridiales sp. JEL 0842]
MTSSSQWLPLESNPEVMNEYIKKLGVSTSLAFADVWALDEEMLQFVPRPVAAVMLLFPVTPKYEEFRKSEEDRLKKEGQIVSDKLYFTKQTIGNACGTIGLIHALANNLDVVDIGNGVLKKILDKGANKTPTERAELLEKEGEELAKIHDESSQQGQTAAPERGEEVDLHFVAFVKVDGALYEMDGRKPFPINHGECEDLLLGAAKVIQGFIDREPGET